MHRFSAFVAISCRTILLLAIGSFLHLTARVRADIPVGPPLDIRFLRPPPEPIGPSSRRAAIVISEVMYHPARRSDGRDLQFIEIFNSQPWFEDVGGWRLSGAVNYEFPTNTILAARSYLVVAANPLDLKTFASIGNVVGPFQGSLPNGSGRLRLQNRQGAVDFELDYRDDGSWPAATDGAGHSLVLARPSYGERDPRAWAASERIGGSPGAAEPAPNPRFRTVFINEFRAHSVDAGRDFIELFNYSTSGVDLSGCTLTDDPDRDRFRLPEGSIISPNSFLVFDETQLGFGLSSTGESIFLKTPDDRRVIDAVRFGPQEADVSTGRHPDGAPGFRRLTSSTPGARNAEPLAPLVIINEVLYHPPSDDPDDEFIEFFNPSSVWLVDLSGWQLDGAKFTFPQNTVIDRRGFIVLARNAARMRTLHPELPADVIVGNFSGSLSGRGEKLTLLQPVPFVSTIAAGETVTKYLPVVVDEFSYGTGGRWGQWSDGGGSSLELRNPRADRSLAPNWADSDESGKSDWVTVETTGTLDNGNTSADSLNITLSGPGECLLDDVEVIGSGGTNRITNADFENGTTGWVFQGNHSYTTIEEGRGYRSARSLHVRATGAGNTGANRIRVPLRGTLGANQTATLRARVLWLKGSTQILLRLHGNWLEAPGELRNARSSGTPGRTNSTYVPNSPPAIIDVTHWPIGPAVGQSITVVARAEDPDGLASLRLRYRVDPVTNVFTEVTMTNNGGGLYSASIPSQGTGALVAFHLVAEDAAPQPAAATFPSDAPLRECLVRWGETVPTSTMGLYRLWLTKDTVNRWTKREKLSNDPLDGTFAYGNYRVIYNAGAMFSGSPYHAPGYSGPTGANCDYVVFFPPDDELLGETEINLLQPGNGGGDVTCQQELHAYWIASQLGLPFCHRRPVLLWVNGVRRGVTFEDAQQPNGDFIQQWFPDDPDGALHKIQLWFEFDNSASSFMPTGADLAKYTTTGGRKKLARYRWTWPRRSFGPEANNYSDLFALVDTVNTAAAGDDYDRTLQASVDVDEWFRTDVTEHIVGNNDSYSYGGGQNMYAYKPTRGPWKLMIWDIDFAFAAADPRSDLFSIGGKTVGPVNTRPAFSRLYWQALADAANGPLTTNRSNPIIDARYNGMRANGASVASGSSIKSFVATRRSHILQLLGTVAAPLKITANGGADFDSPSNLVTLTGSAPVTLRTLTLNGQPVTPTWTKLTNWTLRVPLNPGRNPLIVGGLDTSGRPVTNKPVSIMVNFTEAAESPVGPIHFSEVMNHPAQPGAGFVELHNRSAKTAFDLSGWRLEGVNFTLPPGTFLAPASFLVVAEDAYVFSATYGPLIRVAGVYSGRLAPDGETLRLVQPGTPPLADIIVSEFRYASGPPWPPALEGSSLQLVDENQDLRRPSNWAAAPVGPTKPGSQWQRVVVTGPASSSTLYLYLENIGEAYVDDVKLVRGTDPDAGPDLLANGDFESTLSGPFQVSPNLAESELSGSFRHSGGNSLHLVSSSPGSTRGSSIFQNIVPALTADAPHTLSFWYLPNPEGGVLTVRLSGSGIHRSVELQPTGFALAPATPGKANSVATVLPPFPQVWLNEVQLENAAGPTDNAGEHEPWVELFNAGNAPLSLADCYLSDDPALPTRWRFPAEAAIAPGAFRLVWLDGQEAQTTAEHWHANFRAAADAGQLVLSRVVGGLTNALDSLRYVSPGVDRSLGSFPDGDPLRRFVMVQATPAAANSLAGLPIHVFINEWMADNAHTLADPADGHADDWFELFNAGAGPVNLSGYFLSDSLAGWNRFPIPAGYSIAPGGRLLVWADNQPEQNVPANAGLHVNFKLDAAGETIVLSAPDGKPVDAVKFARQTADVSEGRVPDGSANIATLPTPTPGEANAIPPPVFGAATTSAGAVVLTLETLPGVRYQIEYSDSIPPAGWQPWGAPFTATIRNTALAEALTAGAARFYRARIVP